MGKTGSSERSLLFHLLVWHIHQVHIDQTPGHAHRRLKAEIIEIFELDDRLLDKRRGVAWNKFGASYGLECDQSCFFFFTCHGARSCDQCEKIWAIATNVKNMSHLQDFMLRFFKALIALSCS